MAKIRTLLAGLLMTGFLLFATATPAEAGWPSAEDVVKKVAPLAGLTPDQVEFVIFALKEPGCAATVASYTAAQDYSLIGFIAALKAAKLQSVAGLPAMSEGQCTAYNPVQRAYIFVDTVGDKVLGSAKANKLRELLKEQIEEGKSSLDAELASIPYVGPVLTNWNCACTAAYQTKLSSEKSIDAAVTGVISVGRAVKSGDIPGALETMITVLGPKVACQLGADWTGVGSIPVVSDIASKACESVAGKAVEWVVSGASTGAQALGIIGGPHIPPEEYYQKMFAPELGKDGYTELADILYDKCYKYFEASNMAASTAKKVCVGLRARYVEESIGKLQWAAFQNERESYYNKNVKPKATEAALKNDAEFDAIKKEVETTCKAYFTQKYPKASAYGKEPIEEICTSFVTYSTSQYHPWDMDKVRNQAQMSITSEVATKNTPFCEKDSGERNAINCEDDGLQACTASLPDLCLKSKSKLGGWQVPCCRLGTPKSSVVAMSKTTADNFAKKQAPYCKTESKDPLRVSCALQQAYDGCMKSAAIGCDKASKNPNGTAAQICCALDTSWLETVTGVKEAKSVVEASSGNCAIGGMQKGLSYDPRIVNCSPGSALASCEAKFKGECQALPSGYAGAPCCEQAVFANSSDDKKKAYDPSSRSQDDLSQTAAVVSSSHGDCHYGTTKDGKEDKFKVVCDTLGSSNVCLKKLGRPATTACSKKMQDGWVTSPCCERSPKALQMDARDAHTTDVEAPKAGDTGTLIVNKPPAGGLGSGSGLGSSRRTSPPNGSGLSAPKAGDNKSFGSMPSSGSTTPRRATTPTRSTTPLRRTEPSTTGSGEDRRATEDDVPNYKP